MDVVRTPVFEGPLDLLLHLIESQDLDITTVSLIEVTDQYLAALRSGEHDFHFQFRISGRSGLCR